MVNKYHSIRNVIRNPHAFLLLIIACIFIFLYIEGFIYQRDSIGYGNMHPVRSMGYPILILFFKMLSINHYLNYLFAFQCILGAFVIFYATIAILRQFNLKNWTSFFIAFVLLIPYIVKVKIGSHIYSEAVTYPLFLLFLIAIMRYYYSESEKQLYISILLLTLLTIIRTQFIFVFPALIILLLIQFILKRILLKNLIAYSLILILSYAFINLIDCSYHLIAHKKFTRTPFTGIQLLTEIIYVSEKADTVLFDDLTSKSAFKTIISAVESKNFNKKSFLKQSPYTSKDNINKHYRNTYNLICWGTIVQLYKRALNLNEKNIEGWIELDKITLSMSKTLLKKHYVDYFLNQFVDIYFYGFFPHFGLVFSLLFGLILVITLKKNRISGFLLFLILLDFSNILLCSLVEPLLIRYIFYTKIALFVNLSVFSVSALSKSEDKIE
jgi:hypothetical protein